MLQCPKTSVWVENPMGRDLRDAIGLKDFREIENPVMIRGENGDVYELEDIMRWLREAGDGRRTSPLTRRPFTAMDLEPVRYPGFQGYDDTCKALYQATMQTAHMHIADGEPSVRAGMRMATPLWPHELDHPVHVLHPLQQKEIDELRNQYYVIQQLLKDKLYSHAFIIQIRKNIDNLRLEISLCQGGVDALREFDVVEATITDLLHDEQCLMETYNTFQRLISENAANAHNHLYKNTIDELRERIGSRPNGAAILRLFDRAHHATLSTSHGIAIRQPPVDPRDIEKLEGIYRQYYDLVISSDCALEFRNALLLPLKATIMNLRPRIAKRAGGEQALRQFDDIVESIRHATRITEGVIDLDH